MLLRRFSGVALALACIAGPAAADDPAPDPAAVKVLSDFMTALQIADEDASAKAVMPYVHKSLLNPAGTDLSRDLRQFSFHKAHTSARMYPTPVKVTRVRMTNITAIGFKQTAEAGTTVDYFIARNDSATVPVRIFFPRSGAPKIAYMGSL